MRSVKVYTRSDAVHTYNKVSHVGIVIDTQTLKIIYEKGGAKHVVEYPLSAIERHDVTDD
jgi:hypothetical protein